MPASPDPALPTDRPGAAPDRCAPTAVRLVPAREGVEVSWSPVPGAAGYELELLAADGSPLRPAPAFVLRECGATVDTSSLPEGAGLRVRVRAVGPFSEAAVLPAAPPAPTVRRAGDAVRVEWAEADGATGYELHLLDASGRLLSPQPPIAVEGAAATIPGGALEPGGSYLARLRVLAGESLGPWSPPAAVVLDELLADASGDAAAAVTGGASPGEPAVGASAEVAPAGDAEPVAEPAAEPEVELAPPLGPLRERLRAAGGQVVLTPELLGDAELVRRLDVLLGLAGAGLSLQDARVVSDEEGVILTGDALLFGRPWLETALRFTADGDGGLRLALHAALGDLMLGDLYAGEVLQEPPFDTGDWRSLALPGLALELDSAAGEARLVGEPSPEPWEVVGLDGVALGSVSADLRIRVGSDGLREVEPTAATVMAVDELSLHATLALPHSLRGWSLRLADTEPVPLDEIDALSPLLGGTGAGLPRVLAAAAPFALAALDLSWTPLHPKEWDLWLELAARDAGEGDSDTGDGGAAVWRLDGGVVLAEPSAAVGIALRPVDGERRAIPSGSIQGMVALGGERVPAVVDLPADGGPYQLRLIPAGAVEPAVAASLPGLEGLVLADQLAPLGRFEALALELAEVTLVPGEAAVDGVQLVLQATRASGEGDATPAEAVSLTVEFSSAALDGSRSVAVTVGPTTLSSTAGPVETTTVTWPSPPPEAGVTRGEIKSTELPINVQEPAGVTADGESSGDEPVEAANEVLPARSAPAAEADGSEADPPGEQPDAAAAVDPEPDGIPAPGEVRALFLSAPGRLVAEWRPVEGAIAYHAQLVDAAGEPLDPTSAYAFTEPCGGIDARDLAHGLEHGLRVRAVVGEETGAWSPAAPFTPAALPAPQGLRLEPDGNGVRATWSAAGGAADYEAQALGSDGRVPDPAPAVEVSGTTALIAGGGTADAAVARVRVRARAAGTAGPWAVSAPLPARVVPAPAWSGEPAQADEPAVVPATLGPDPDDGAG